MKNLFLISLLALLGMTQAVAQEYEYVPFVREGVKWGYSIKDYRYYDYQINPANGDCIAHRTLEFRGDTVISGKTYKAMHRCVDDEISEPSDVVPIYLREEDKKVYGIVPNQMFYSDARIGNFMYGCQDEDYFDYIRSGQEFLLYDFQDPLTYWGNLIEDDWFNLQLQLDTIEVGGHYAKRLFDERQEGDYFQVIEGIGATGMNSYPLAFFMPVCTGIHCTEYYSLEKVVENGEVIYPQNYVEDRYMPLILEGVKWVNEKIVVNNGDTTCSYYTYEFSGNDYKKDKYGTTFKALYRNDGCNHELDVENDSLVAGLREAWKDIEYLRNEPLDQVISQGRNLIAFGQGYLYHLIESDDGWGTCKDYYIENQKEPVLNNDNFVEVDPIKIGRYNCSRLAYIGESGDTLAYVVEGIGFDSYDMGDLLTPFTRKPDPNADYQEWCGLSHVIKDGQIIYKGMRYREGAYDGIDEVVADQRPRHYDGNYYDLTGRCMGTEVPTTPGIYIHNGNKICVSRMQ